MQAFCPLLLSDFSENRHVSTYLVKFLTIHIMKIVSVVLELLNTRQFYRQTDIQKDMATFRCKCIKDIRFRVNVLLVTGGVLLCWWVIV
jgi:hypothetical protein